MPDPMFVLLVHYTQPMDKVQTVTPAHREYLDKAVASGHLLVSGRRNPPVGGAVIARFKSLDDARAFTEADPFVTQGVARYDIIEFAAVKHAPEIKTWLGL